MTSSAEPSSAANTELAAALAKIAAGDHAGFEDLYRRTSARLFGVCLRVLPTSAEAEEALQEAYLSVWRRAGSYDPTRGHAMTWLIAIARNAAIDRLRASRQHPMGPIDLADDVPDPTPSAFDRLGDDDEGRLLARCMEQLVAGDVRLITAAFFEGSRYSELAQRTGAPLGTIKSRVRRALLKLRDCLR